jgi:hypothetical protein
MNLVDLIKGLLPGDVLSKLSGLLGLGEDKTKAAVGAAVPALLSGVSSLASTPGGAEKVTRALEGLDTGMLNNLGGMISGGGGGYLDKGKDMLGSLFGGSMLSGLTGTLSKYLGLGEGVVGKLLGFLGPVALGGILKQAGGRVPSAAGLTDLLASQKSNITNALPGGLNLGTIPGIGTAKAVAGAAADATGNLSRWLLPLLAVLAVAFLAWWFLIRDKGTSTTPTHSPSGPEVKVPGIDVLTGDLTGSLKGLTETLAGVKDVATAEAALPKLNDLNARLGTIKTGWDQLPAAGKTSLSDIVKSRLGGLRETIDKLIGMTGIGDKLKPVLESLLAKLTSLEG